MKFRMIVSSDVSEHDDDDDDDREASAHYGKRTKQKHIKCNCNMNTCEWSVITKFFVDQNDLEGSR